MGLRATEKCKFVTARTRLHNSRRNRVRTVPVTTFNQAYQKCCDHFLLIFFYILRWVEKCVQCREVGLSHSGVKNPHISVFNGPLDVWLDKLSSCDRLGSARSKRRIQRGFIDDRGFRDAEIREDRSFATNCQIVAAAGRALSEELAIIVLKAAGQDRS